MLIYILLKSTDMKHCLTREYWHKQIVLVITVLPAPSSIVRNHSKIYGIYF